nr:hypothetical protein CFP56_71645 [Quercus suber]
MCVTEFKVFDGWYVLNPIPHNCAKMPGKAVGLRSAEADGALGAALDAVAGAASGATPEAGEAALDEAAGVGSKGVAVEDAAGKGALDDVAPGVTSGASLKRGRKKGLFAYSSAIVVFEADVVGTHSLRESMMNQMLHLDVNSQIGSCMPLAAMRIGTMIHNIEVTRVKVAS